MFFAYTYFIGVGWGGGAFKATYQKGRDSSGIY